MEDGDGKLNVIGASRAMGSASSFFKRRLRLGIFHIVFGQLCPSAESETLTPKRLLEKGRKLGLTGNSKEALKLESGGVTIDVVRGSRHSEIVPIP